MTARSWPAHPFASGAATNLDVDWALDDALETLNDLIAADYHGDCLVEVWEDHGGPEGGPVQPVHTGWCFLPAKHDGWHQTS